MSPGVAPVHVVYFAWVREKAGLAAEEVTPPDNVTDVAALISWLHARGGGPARALADLSLLRIAVNHQHAGLDQPVGQNDEVAFFPPITGG